MKNQSSAHIAVHAFKILRSLYQVSTNLHASENRQDLIFRILNNTIDLFQYRRAVLWSLNGKKPVLLGVSGREDVNKQSHLAKLWEPVVESLRESKRGHILEQIPNHLTDLWNGLVEQTAGLSVMWIPIILDGKLHAGLWLERWGEEVWDPSECEVMHSYEQNLRLAWKQFDRTPRLQRIKSFRPKGISMAIIAIILVFLAYAPIISLRVVAPCEIIPKDPEMYAAPLDGVIKEILVKPGDYVKAGDLLFLYEDRIIMHELKVAQKQVEIIRSQYDRQRFKSFIDNDVMAEIQSLKYRLEQEEIRLALAQSNVNHLKIQAKRNGVCMVDHPEQWQGRPVRIGERVVMIFHTDQSKVKIFLPEKDNIEFDKDKPVSIILNAAPANRYRANLNYIAPQASKGPKGDLYFQAEAQWLQHGTRIKVGSKGTAVIYGDKVSLIYWILRKPVAYARQFAGI